MKDGFIAKFADDTYCEILSSSREGINQTPESMQELEVGLITTLHKNGTNRWNLVLHFQHLIKTGIYFFIQRKKLLI